MRKILFKAIPFDKKLVTLALESGVDAILAEEDRAADVKSLSRVEVVLPSDLETVALRAKADEERAAAVLEAGGRVLLSEGWEIIPVENLLAVNSGELCVEADSLERAELAAGILERGVDCVVLTPKAAPEIKAVMERIRPGRGEVDLVEAVITEITPAGLGHRVCVDTLSLLKTGEGMLTGNSSAFTFLVHAETEENPYVASRPFRVNAGAVHAYVSLPGDKTCYLEELSAGREVLVADASGKTRPVTVGRSKVEIRPMLLITAEADGARGGVFLQNAETIRLVRPGGEPVSVVTLEVGDKILCRTDTAGRHFGMRVAEDIGES